MGYVECGVFGCPSPRVRQESSDPRYALDRLRTGWADEPGTRRGGRTRARPRRAVSAAGANRFAIWVPGNRALLRDRYADRAGRDGGVSHGGPRIRLASLRVGGTSTCYRDRG